MKSVKVFLLFASVSVLVLSAGRSNAESPDQLLKKGAEAWKNDTPYEAIRYYRDAAAGLKSTEKKALAYFKVATGYFSTGHRVLARHYFEKILSLGTSNKVINQRANYYIGLSYYGQKDAQKSRSFFLNAVQTGNDVEVKWKSRLMLNRTKLVNPKRWTLVASAGGLYDSNLVLETHDGKRYDNDVSDKMGYAMVGALVPQYARMLGDHELSVSNRLGFTWYVNDSSVTDDYDTLSETLSTKITSPYTLGGYPFYVAHNLSYDTVFSRGEDGASRGGDQYGNFFNYYATLTPYFTKKWNFDVGMGMSKLDFKERGRGSEYTGRDGYDFHSHLSPSVYGFGANWKFLAAYTRANRKGLNEMFKRYRGRLSSQFPFYWGTNMSISGELFYRKFHKRLADIRENGVTAGLNLSKMLKPAMGVSALTQYTNNISRPGTTSYTRIVSGVNVFYLF
jgi:tetratricopeptide (TPR) repeat protein